VHSIHCPLTDIVVHHNQDWSGEAVICVRNVEITVVAHSLLIGLPIITKHPSPAAAIDHTLLQRAIAMSVEKYMKYQFECGVDTLETERDDLHPHEVRRLIASLDIVHGDTK
jgi:hypothetical protein